MTIKKIIKATAITLVSLIVVALGTLYLWSTIVLNKTYDIPLTEVHIPNDSVSIVEGQGSHILHIAVIVMVSI